MALYQGQPHIRLPEERVCSCQMVISLILKLLGISKGQWWSRAYRAGVVSAVGMVPSALVSFLLAGAVTE